MENTLINELRKLLAISDLYDFIEEGCDEDGNPFYKVILKEICKTD